MFDQHALDRARTRRSNFNFRMVDIPDGAVLTFSRDPEITCTVISSKKVEFEEEETSLSTSALTVFQRMGFIMSSVAGPLHWEYDGETLAERRDRMEAGDS